MSASALRRRKVDFEEVIRRKLGKHRGRGGKPLLKKRPLLQAVHPKM